MALRDLLWSCPLCGEAPLENARRRSATCPACGTRFTRRHGAMIEARRPSGERIVLPAAEWADRLPEPVALGEGEGGEERSARVLARFSRGLAPVRWHGRFLGRIEQYTEPIEGTLTLSPDRLAFHPAGGEGTVWPLEQLTAVQPSSNTLQIKARGEDVVSFRFLDDSSRYWELLLAATLRAFYRRTGRGEIIEFQPRIVAR